MAAVKLDTSPVCEQSERRAGRAFFGGLLFALPSL
jgi:hypothetical protein